MEYITPDDARAFAAIWVALGELHAYDDPAALWHEGERHEDDAGDDPQLLADERPGWLLRQAQQADGL